MFFDSKDPEKNAVNELESYYGNPFHRLFHRKDYKEFKKIKERYEASHPNETVSYKK